MYTHICHSCTYTYSCTHTHIYIHTFTVIYDIQVKKCAYLLQEKKEKHFSRIPIYYLRTQTPLNYVYICQSVYIFATFHTYLHIRRSYARYIYRECLIIIGHFPQKSPIISGSFAKNDLQLKTSYGCLPPCTQVAGRLLQKKPLIKGLFCRK